MQNTFVTQVLPAGNLNPMKDGSMMPLPPGSIVPTVVNGSIIPVKTIPDATASVLTTQTIPVQTVRQSYVIPAPTTSVVQT